MEAKAGGYDWREQSVRPASKGELQAESVAGFTVPRAAVWAKWLAECAATRESDACLLQRIGRCGSWREERSTTWAKAACAPFWLSFSGLIMKVQLPLDTKIPIQVVE